MSRRSVPGGWKTRSDGSRAWRLPYRDPITGRQTSRTFATKGEAETFLDELRHGARAGTYIAPDAGRDRFADFASEWAESQDWAPSTRDAFASSLKRIKVRIGAERRLDQIDELLLARLRQSLTADYATATATVTLHYATAIMRAAHRLRKVPRDVTEAIDPPRDRSGKAAGVGPDDIPTRAEVTATIEHAPPKWQAAIALGACGLRVSEVLGLHAEQYDNEVLVVDRQYQRINGEDRFPKPKRDKIRRIVLPEWAVEQLDRHLEEHQGGGALFRGRLGQPVRRDSFYVQAWRPALRAAGIDERAYKFHALRHWCASGLLAERTPLPAVAGYLGDTVETVGRTYAHWLRDDRDVPAHVLTRMLRPQLEIVANVGS